MVLRESACAFACGLLGAIATTWPLASRLGTGARDRVDHLYEAWLVDWIIRSLTSPSKLFDPNLFHPASASATGADPLLGVAIPLAPLRWLGLGPLAVHNVGLLLAVAWSCAAGYACGRVVTGTRSGGVLVGAAVAFGPVLTTEGGHLQIIACAGLPLSVLGAWLVVDAARAGGAPSGGGVALLAGALAWQVSVSFYVAFYAAVAAGVVLLLGVRALRRAEWVRLAAGALACGAVAVPLAVQYGRRPEPVPSLGEALARVGPLSGDFVHTHPKLLVWGAPLGRGSGWFALTGGAFPGLTLVLLALVGVWVAHRGRGTDPRLARRALVGLALVGVGFVLALGAAAEGPRRYTPWRVALQFVPPLRGFRAANRGVLVALVGLALLAAPAVPWCAARLRSSRRVGPTAVALAVAALVWLEGFGSWGGTPQVRVHEVDRALASPAVAPEPGAVLYLPVPIGDVATVAEWSQAEIAFRSTAHHRPTVNGYGSYIPESYFAAKRAATALPAPDAVAALRAIDVRYVVVDRAAVADTPWASLATPTATPGMRLVRDLGDDLLYELG